MLLRFMMAPEAVNKWQTPALSTSISKPVTVNDTSFHEGVGSALWSM